MVSMGGGWVSNIFRKTVSTIAQKRGTSLLSYLPMFSVKATPAENMQI